MRPNLFENFVEVRIFDQVMVTRFHLSGDDDLKTSQFKIPNGSMWDEEEVRFWPTHQPLNEFGYLYVALYIAGNYARYYPDKWLCDVEQSTPLALAVEQLVHIVEQRMALLAYNELSRTCHVPAH